VEAYPYSN